MPNVLSLVVCQPPTSKVIFIGLPVYKVKDDHVWLVKNKDVVG